MQEYRIVEEVVKFKCLQCNHIWKPVNEYKEPVKCPKCQSIKWRERKIRRDI